MMAVVPPAVKGWTLDPVWLYYLVLFLIGTVGVFTAVAAVLMSPGVEKRKIRMTATGFSGVVLISLLLYFLFLFRIGECVLTEAVDGILVAAGCLLMTAGAVLYIAARLGLGANWSDRIEIREQHRLIEGGVYRWVRHPIFTALLFLFLGVSFIYRNIAGLAVSLFVVFPAILWRSGKEEKLLLERFPEYDDYAKRTGKFIPGIGRKK